MQLFRFKDIREDKDLLQVDIVEILNITQCQYSLYENVFRSMPIEKLIILANYYNVSTDYLLGLTNERKPYPKQNKILKPVIRFTIHWFLLTSYMPYQVCFLF